MEKNEEKKGKMRKFGEKCGKMGKLDFPHFIFVVMKNN